MMPSVKVQLPGKIVELSAAFLFRDGGSLSASFEDENGRWLSLFLKVDWGPPDSDHRVRRYSAPYLEEFLKSEYTSPITGVTAPLSEQISMEITWDQAVDYLEQMKTARSTISAADREYFEWMCTIASDPFHIL